MQYILTEEVLISQEPSTTFTNNPIQVVIDNTDLLTKVQQHLLRGGKISAEIINLVLPTKFTLSSNYLLIEVENWTFKEISYINSKPFYIMGDEDGKKRFLQFFPPSLPPALFFFFDVRIMTTPRLFVPCRGGNPGDFSKAEPNNRMGCI